MTQDLNLYHEVSQYIFHETRLLDRQNWNAWMDLFTEDGTYWAPASQNQPDPVQHVSLIFENTLLRKVRIERFKSPVAPSLQPFPQSTHLVSNVIIDSADSEQVVASARFLMSEYRRDILTHYAGEYVYDLARRADGFKIRQKKAVLVNCEGAHISSSTYF